MEDDIREARNLIKALNIMLPDTQENSDEYIAEGLAGVIKALGDRIEFYRRKILQEAQAG